MSETFSPKRVAAAIGVSESSLKRWCDAGQMAMVKTPGGHRRIELAAVVEFLRQNRRQLTQPDLIGLPAELSLEQTEESDDSAVVEQALASGDYVGLRSRIFKRYLAGRTVAQLCDELLSPQFAKLGHSWQDGKLEVYQERRAVECCIRLVNEWRSLLPAIPSREFTAIGGTLEDDPYQLPTQMVALTLRDQGWNAESYGAGLPVATLQAAIATERPRLCWLSVSTFASRERLIASCQALAETAATHGCAIALGGRALVDDVRPALPYTVFCDQLHHLVTFANQLRPAANSADRHPNS